MSKQTDLRILIIDDNTDIHSDFIKILTTSAPKNSELLAMESLLFGETKSDADKFALPKFHIDTATQGQEGVEKIAKAQHEGNSYALAFVDVRMPPGWDGIETIKHIWALDPDIQVVICTAYSDYSWEETVEQLGQKENLLILKKPFDHVAVRQLSCALTKKWQLLQESRNYTQSLEAHVKERTSSLQESLSIARGTLESSVDGILIVNNENKIIDYNKKIVEIWSIPISVLDTNDSAILFEFISQNMEKPKEFLEMITELTHNPHATKLEKLKCNKDIFLECYTQVYKIDEKIAGRIWSFRDITKRALLEEKLEYQTMHDTLTGLPNRALLTNRIRHAIAKGKRHGTLFALFFFDLDRFKLINDSLSHAAGDELLQAVAKRIKFSIREEDTLARVGGDEFIILAEAMDKNELDRIPIKILDCFTKPFEIADNSIMLTTSIGISVFPIDGSEAGELLRKADIAMYRVKELCGNRFQFYTEELGKYNVERSAKESELRQAITNEELFLCYQPQIDVATNKIVSVEALIRWQHPKEGVVFPMNFIPLAEETGLIATINRWILRKACQQNKLWQEQGLPKVRIAVNIETQQLKQNDLAKTIEAILKETGLEAEYLELELTENVIINNPRAVAVITELKKIGVHFSLDNFGTGTSSLSYLRDIPIDRLKIDQSFVKNIDENSNDEIIIQAIISMARDLNLEILAEGVESQQRLEFLKVKKSAEIQGSYFSKPLLADDLEKVLKDQGSFNSMTQNES